MRDDYDFSNGIKNPYADKLKKQITIRLDDEVVNYFKNMAEETGMPYQNIINYYLKDCVKERRQVAGAVACGSLFVQLSRQLCRRYASAKPQMQVKRQLCAQRRALECKYTMDLCLMKILINENGIIN